MTDMAVAHAVTSANDAHDQGAREKVLGRAANELVFAVVGHVGSGTSAIADQLAHLLALLWQFMAGRHCERLFTVGAAQRWRPGEEVEDGLPDGRHARFRRRSSDSFFSVPPL